MKRKSFVKITPDEGKLEVGKYGKVEAGNRGYNLEQLKKKMMALIDEGIVKEIIINLKEEDEQ